MKNSTKLKHILQLYKMSLDMDDEGNFHLMLLNKKDNNTVTFIDKAYTIVIGKAFGHLKRELKNEVLN